MRAGTPTPSSAQAPPSGQARVATAAPPTTPASQAGTPDAATPEARPAEAPSGPGRFALGASAYNIPENKGMVAIRLLRRGGTRGPSSLTWWTTPDSAQPGDDYADFGYRVEPFASGETQRVVYVPIASDQLAEPRETFTVHITNPTNGGQLEGPTTATVTIIDDD
jgi:hypothetical protein